MTNDESHDLAPDDAATPTAGRDAARAPARRRIVLTGISSRTWEHPADRGALTALRELRGFDEVLKAMSGIWNERAYRMQYLGSAIRVELLAALEERALERGTQLVGLTQDEAAAQLGWGKTTLRRRLDEARTALGRRLRGNGAGPAALSAVLLSDCLGAATPSQGLVAATLKSR